MAACATVLMVPSPPPATITCGVALPAAFTAAAIPALSWAKTIWASHPAALKASVTARDSSRGPPALAFMMTSMRRSDVAVEGEGATAFSVISCGSVKRGGARPRA
jgi:hypothetical protein